MNLIFVALVVVVAFGCASSSGGRSGWAYGRAGELYAAKDFTKALEYSENQLFSDGEFSSAEHLDLHYAILRRLERVEALKALQLFVDWYASGENTTARPAYPTKDDCKDMTRERRHKTNGVLVKEGVRPRRRELPARYGRKPWVATFELARDGSRNEIKILRAQNPAVAWYLIDSADTTDLYVRRFDKVDDSHFPLSYCSWKGPAGFESGGGVGRGSGR